MSQPNFSYTSLSHLFFFTFGIDGCLLVDGPLYFIRNLIIMCLISPLVFYIIKRANLVVVMLFVILWGIQNIVVELWGSF